MSRRARRLSPSWLRVALVSALYLAPGVAAWAQGGDSPQPPPPSPPACEADVQRLQADADERLRQIEALKGMLAASEKAWRANQALLESMRKQFREELAAHQASDVRKDKAFAHAGEALRAAEAATKQQATLAADLERKVHALQNEIDQLNANRRKLATEVSSLRKTQESRDRSHAAELATREAEAKRLGARLAEAERERASAVAALAAKKKEIASAEQEVDSLKRSREVATHKALELDRQISVLRASVAEQSAAKKRLAAEVARLTREHEERAAPEGAKGGAEQASGATVQELERTLREERRASQSKLEALESVLKSTRSASASLRSGLEDARTRNSDLARQVESLKAAVHKVHELQTSYQENDLRLEKLEQQKDADPAEMRSLQSQRTSLAAKIRRARSEQVANAARVTGWMKAEEPPFAPVPPASGAANDEEEANADLREQLSLERERRETLEGEVKRLTASGDNDQKFLEVWNALQSARSEILVLTHQLADERRSRENLEVALARVKEASGVEGQSAPENATRLAETLEARRAEADRLAEQLKAANEVIVQLKGRLEAAGTSTGKGDVLEEVSRENEKLRTALKSAEEANRSLREKAEMAARLAELVYGNSP